MALLLVGLDNPQSRDPRFALYPQPPGCSGYRLWKMMLEQSDGSLDYSKIAKTNLFPVGPASSMKVLVRDAGRVLCDQIIHAPWTVVLVGAVVRDAVMPEYVGRDWKPCRFVSVIGDTESKVAWIPHPSGRNHFYNDKKNCRKIGKFLVEAYRS